MNDREIDRVDPADGSGKVPQEQAGTGAMLISVGGTPEPVAYTIRHHRPGKIVFFASPDSRGRILSDIQAVSGHAWSDHEIITTPDPQHLTQCMQVLRSELPGRLRVLGITEDELTVDYTGGTKTMSAALVLATINMRVGYSYVGGRVRGKDGLGVVKDGSEEIMYAPNPWDVLALDVGRRLGRQFNAGRFAEAQDTARDAAKRFAEVQDTARDGADRVGEDLREFFLALEKIAEAYRCWDTFDFSSAQGPFRQGLRMIKPWILLKRDPEWEKFHGSLTNDLARLETIVPTFRALQKNVSEGNQDGVRALFLDLTANAIRTAHPYARPDDGVARLYSLLEKQAKLTLMEHGIDNSAADPRDIPESLREDYQARYSDAESGLLKFGSAASYELLVELSHPLGERYQARRKELRNLLTRRNGSLMVHGWAPVKMADFDRFLDIVKDFLELPEDEIPSFSKMPEF